MLSCRSVVFSALLLAYSTSVFAFEIPLAMEQTINTTALTQARSIVFADIDGDGDLDVVANAQGTGEIVWFENVNGDGSVWTKHLVDGDFGEVFFISTADINRNGHLDIVALNFNLGTLAGATSLAWYENPGNPSEVVGWESHPIAQDLITSRVLLLLELDKPETGISTRSNFRRQSYGRREACTQAFFIGGQGGGREAALGVRRAGLRHL